MFLSYFYLFVCLFVWGVCIWGRGATDLVMPWVLFKTEATTPFLHFHLKHETFLCIIREKGYHKMREKKGRERERKK